MASPLPSQKQSVSLSGDGPRVSRIRRDPPAPAATKTVILSRNERDTLTVVWGIVISAVLLVTILVGFASYNGWSPRDYTAHL